MRKVLVYRAHLPEDARRVISVSVLPGRSAAGLGVGRLRTPCRVMIRYVTADDRVRRHRGQLLTALAPGAVVQVAAWQAEGREVLVSLRPVPARGGAPAAPGAAVADCFTLPFGLQAWGVTAVSGARARLRLACRARPGALALRGTLRLILETPGGALRLRIPFLRLFAAPEAVPGALRWRAVGRVQALHASVGPGGEISGLLVLAVRCEGRPVGRPAEHAREPELRLDAVRELAGRITGLCAEPAGSGCAIVRGAVDLDIYWTDGGGASRWAGRAVPFAELVAVADGDRLEAAARIEGLSHGPAGIRLSLVLRVTALRTETVRLDGACYRAERVAGEGETTAFLLVAAPGEPGEARPVPLPAPRPAPARGHWTEVPMLPAPPPGGGSQLHVALPAPARAVVGLQISGDGQIEALVRTDQGIHLVRGQAPGHTARPTGAIAYPIMHDDRWLLRVVLTQEGIGHKTS